MLRLWAFVEHNELGCCTEAAQQRPRPGPLSDGMNVHSRFGGPDQVYSWRDIVNFVRMEDRRS